MDNMGERIRQRRKELNMTQTELGAKLNVKASAVAKYESGRVENIKKSNILKLASALETTPEYLFGWVDEEPMLNSFYDIEIRALPVLGEVACGEPIFTDNSPMDFVSLKDAPSNADFILIARGDSMNGARICDGDYVFIKKQSTVNNGEIAAVIINDEATLKRVHYDEQNKILQLIPENSNYQPLVFVGEQLNDVKIIGKAIAFQSEIK